jgi:single-stranded DNA-binding protein
VSLTILAQGTRVADPQRRTSSKGSDYATCNLRVATEGEAALVSCVAFDADAVQAMLALSKGDAVSVAGKAKLTSWAGRDGEQRFGLDVTVTRVPTIDDAKRQSKPRADSTTKPVATQSARGKVPHFEDMSDDLPWRQ